jgi:anti-sigma regulatory factor (Ser/Thr protein kinase)
VIVRTTVLRSGPSEEAEVRRQLSPGEPFWVLDDSVGWAWGYAGMERRVGYVRLEAISAA